MSWISYPVGRFSSVHRWPVLGVPRGYAGGMRGIGSYAFILGLTEGQQESLWTNQYTIIVDASFQRFLTGSPDMPRYKKWATDIVNGLRNQFDERELWSSLREYYLLHKTFPMGSR
jgi:hypothetical protein